MFFKSALLASLACLSLATPAPEALSEVDAKLEARATANGAVLLFPKANFAGNVVPVFVVPDQPAFCTQFQPIVKGGFNLKSYNANHALLILWKNANCEGNDVYVINSNIAAQNANVNQDVFRSFTIQYLQ